MTFKRPALDTWQMACALMAAEQGSIRRAAEALGTRPARVRRSLLRIEYVTGLSLFQRSRSGVRPTHEGRRFLKEAGHILHGITSLSQQGKRNRSIGTPHLRVGLQTPVITGRITGALAACHERKPNLDIMLETHGRRRLLQYLNLGQIDVAILAGIHQIKEFETRHLWTEHLEVALPETHPLIDRRFLAWTDLLEETFFTGTDGRGRAFHRILRRNLGDLTDTPHIIRQKIPQADILGFVRAGLGLCLTTDAWHEIRIPGVRFMELIGSDIITHLDYVAAWRKEEQNDMLDLFLDAASTFKIIKPTP
jgi:DNA-binding transcriptional LysR family regulator